MKARKTVKMTDIRCMLFYIFEYDLSRLILNLNSDEII